MALFFSFVTSIVISLVLIPILMRYAGTLNMLDEPDERKVHQVAVPRCGGIGLSVGAISAILLFISFNTQLASLVVGSLVIIIFGLLDDRFELSYKWKFFGQFLAVFAAMSGGLYISVVPFLGLQPGSLLVTLPLTLVFVIGVTNAVNLSDGLDGLAAGIMLMTFASIAFLAMDAKGVDAGIIALAITGGIVGFLWFNTHPAVVFMGDTGSQFLGFMAVFLTIYLTQEVNPALNPALPLLLLGLPILDTLTVMVRRIRAGRSPFSPDKSHIHHRMMEYGFSHAEAVGYIYILQGVFLAAAMFFRYASDIVVVGVYAVISATILLFFYWAAEKKWMLHRKHVEGGDRRGHSWLFRNDHLFQFCRHYINYALAIFVVSQLLCISDRIINLPTEAYLAIFAGMLVYIALPKYVQDIWVRFSIYTAAIIASVMKDEIPELATHTQWFMDIYLLLLIVVVSLAIRITRKEKFRVTTQDVLVVLFIIACIFLIDLQWIETVAFRLFCLVYALEYLLHREIYKFRLSRYFSALSGLILGAIILSTL